MNASPNPLCNILVHLDDSVRSADRLRFAQRLASAHGSRLEAVYAALPGYSRVPLAPDGVVPAIELLRDMDNERLRAARQLFDRTLTASGGEATWASCFDVPVESGFTQLALYADLVVLGQHDASDPQSAWTPSDFNEFVIASSGKPAIVLPHSMPLPDEVRRVFVAWKETREAARALAAALPILQRAQQVRVASWAEDAAAAQPAFVRVTRYLQLRGVDAECSYEGPDSPQIGELVLSRAADAGADLLVMGCYGHSRAREWVFGGASRTLFGSMTLPVLMSH